MNLNKCVNGCIANEMLCFVGFAGATKEIGSALTRLCMRHRSIETCLKALTRYVADHTTAKQNNIIMICVILVENEPIGFDKVCG